MRFAGCPDQHKWFARSRPRVAGEKWRGPAGARDHARVSSQRRFPRYAIDAEVTVRGPDGLAIATGRTANLSRGGLCADVDAPLPRGEMVEVAIALVFDAGSVSEPLALPARVVWCTSLGDAHQAGLAFLAPGRDQETYLDMFIRFLEGPEDDDDGDDGDGGEDEPGGGPDRRFDT